MQSIVFFIIEKIWKAFN